MRPAFGEAAGEVIRYPLAKAELVMASDLTLLFGILSFLTKPC
jgi:hypothetical protein